MKWKQLTPSLTACTVMCISPCPGRKCRIPEAGTRSELLASSTYHSTDAKPKRPASRSTVRRAVELVELVLSSVIDHCIGVLVTSVHAERQEVCAMQNNWCLEIFLRGMVMNYIFMW